MSLVYGLGIDSDVIGALSVPRSFAPGKRRGKAVARLVSVAQESFQSAAVLFRCEGSTSARRQPRRSRDRDGEKKIDDAFCCIADVVGLSDEERTVLHGVPGLAGAILALETMSAALDLFHAPETVAAWLRKENDQEPFNKRSPLQLMASDGRLGVEIALLYLRARLRLTSQPTAF